MYNDITARVIYPTDLWGNGVVFHFYFCCFSYCGFRGDADGPGGEWASHQNLPLAPHGEVLGGVNCSTCSYYIKLLQVTTHGKKERHLTNMFSVTPSFLVPSIAFFFSSSSSKHCLLAPRTWAERVFSCCTWALRRRKERQFSSQCESEIDRPSRRFIHIKEINILAMRICFQSFRASHTK